MSDEKKFPAFVIDVTGTIDWPVEVTAPTDGGDQVTTKFIGTFKRFSEKELDNLFGVGEKASASTEDAPAAVVESKRMSEILADNAMKFPEFLVDWKGVTTQDGSDVSFSVERLQAAVIGPNGPYLSAGLWNALREIRSGARLGN